VARASTLRDIIYGEVLQRKGIHPTVRGGVRGRGREEGKRESAGLLLRVVIDDFWWWTSRTPARDFSPTVASPVWFLEGDGRGECGLKGEGVTGMDLLKEGAGKVGEVAASFGRERGGTLERKEPTGGSGLAGWQVGSTR
jgi:hypothetical protein